MFKYGTMLLALAGVLLGAPQAWAQNATNLNCNKCVDTGDIAKKAVSKNRLKNNAVTEKKIKDEAVTEDKIKDEAVTENKIVDEAITEDKIMDGAVTEGKIADNAVNGAKVADGSLTGADIANGTIIADDLGPNSVGLEELSVEVTGGGTGVDFFAAAGLGSRELLTNSNWTPLSGIIEMTVPAPGLVTCIATAFAEMSTLNAFERTIIYLGWTLSPSAQPYSYVSVTGRAPSEEHVEIPVTAMNTFDVTSAGTEVFVLYTKWASGITVGSRSVNVSSTACMYFPVRL